jgi:RHS repeat-associated protein
VFFDDLIITHTKGKVLQEDHYYPFGMNISALGSTAPLSKPNNYKYNGFELETSFDLGWYDYKARFYDPQLGRFMQIDPAADLMRRQSTCNYAFEKPIRFTDPDGMMPNMAGGCPPGVDCQAIERKTQEIVDNVNQKVDNVKRNVGDFFSNLGNLLEDVSSLGQGVMTGRMWFRITGDAPSGDDTGATDIRDIPDGAEVIEVDMSTSENGDSDSFGDFMNLMNGSTPKMKKNSRFNDIAKDVATTVPKVNEVDLKSKTGMVGIERIMEQKSGSFVIRTDSFPSYMQNYVIKAPDTTFTTETAQKRANARANGTR